MSSLNNYKMKIIEIDSSNFVEFQNIDIIAFSFAHIGAQGERGGVKILSSDDTLYHTNITQDIKLEELFSVCPQLSECHFGLFKSSVPTGWVPFYMGGGNFLVVKDRFKKVIQRKAAEGLYNNWIKILCSEIG